MSLSEAELATIAAWVDKGAPRGDLSDMPPPLTFADDRAWKMGTPDLIVSSPTVDMKAIAPDWVGGMYTFHHAAFGVVGPDGRSSFGGWPVHEVGRNPDVFDPEAGKLLPANARLSFLSVHLHSNGLDTKAHLEVGFKFHPKGYKPRLNFQPLFVGNGPDLDIRAMEA